MGASREWERHAFVLTDIESSTRRWELDSASMAVDLAHHDDVLTATMAANGGRLLKRLGDGFLFVFDDAHAATGAAVRAQNALSGTDWPHKALAVRMGVHVGDVQARGGDYFGPTLNRCSRVSAAASGRQILATRDVVAEVASEPDLANRFHHHGACRLRDLGEPMEIWEVLHDSRRGPMAPRALVEGRHNLPYRLSSFVGRRDDLSELQRLVIERRLVSLTGSGGVGKTRLALQVAAIVADDHPDGTWFVPLDSVEGRGQVADRVLEALGLRAVPQEDPLDTLAAAVAGRRMLMVLDCCEHVLDDVSDLVETVASDRIRFLMTSRRPLGIEGEMVWRVRSLRTDGARAEGGSGHQSEAVQLLIERAKERDTEIDFNSPAQLEAAGALARRLDGIPLGIELAAARLGALDVVGLERKLSEGFPLVDESFRRPPRHRTIEATIEWSERLLTEDARWLLRRLTVFSSPPDLDAAEAVCGAELATGTIDILDELIDASMVSMEPDGAGARRFAMLDAVRAFASDRWAPADIVDTRARHATWASTMAATGGPVVHADAAWLERLAAAEDDLVRAIEWLFDNDVDAAVEMVTHLAVFWAVSGQAGTGRRLLDRALGHADALSPTNTARLVEGVGMAAALDTDYERSDQMLVRAADLFVEAGRERRSAYPRFWRARSTIVRGYQGVADRDDLVDAHQRLGRAMATLRAHGDLLGLVLALPYEGWVRELLDLDDPLGPLEEALRITDSPGLERVACYASAHMAHLVLVHDDDPDRASDLIDGALGELRAAHDRQNLLICLLMKAAVELRRGHGAEGRSCVGEAAAIAAGGGSREWEPAVLALGWAVHAPSDALLASTISGHLGSTLPTWRTLLRNTGLAPVLADLDESLESRDELVRRTAENAGRSQSTGQLIALLARSASGSR